MLYPTELRGRAVILTAGGFCQTDTPVARTTRFSFQIASADRSSRLFSGFSEQNRHGNRRCRGECGSCRGKADGRRSASIFSGRHFGRDAVQDLLGSDFAFLPGVVVGGLHSADQVLHRGSVNFEFLSS